MHLASAVIPLSSLTSFVLKVQCYKRFAKGSLPEMILASVFSIADCAVFGSKVGRTEEALMGGGVARKASGNVYLEWEGVRVR